MKGLESGAPRSRLPRRSAADRRDLLRLWPHATAATLLVAVCPLLVVYALESAGIVRSMALAVVLGSLVSAGLAAFGSAVWARLAGAGDIVFGDLMIWGFITRLRSEKSVSEVIDLSEGIDPARRIEVLRKLATALETRDPYTHGHTHRVTRYSHMIAQAMRLPPAQIDKIRTAAAVHDVGKLYVPRGIIDKPGRLTDEEFAAMKQHSAWGAAMVAPAADEEITAMVRHHHERVDGGGYPDGLPGEEIPLGARIIAVADTFDAITSTRSYRGAGRHSEALQVLKAEAGKQLDADVVDAFLACYSGRASRAWWVSLTTAPQRLLTHLAEWLSRAGAGGVPNAVVAVGVAAGLGLPASGNPHRPPEPVAEVAVAPAAIQEAVRYDDPVGSARTERRQRGDATEVGDTSRGSGSTGGGTVGGGDASGVLDDAADAYEDVTGALPETAKLVEETVGTAVGDSADELVDDLIAPAPGLPLP
jgi:hypothetical protein